MKNVQVRFTDEVYRAMEGIAEEEGASIAEIVRRGIQIYAIVRAYSREGKAFMWEDRASGKSAELIIPGITAMATETLYARADG